MAWHGVAGRGAARQGLAGGARRGGAGQGGAGLGKAGGARRGKTQMTQMTREDPPEAADETEVTEEMIDIGIDVLYGFSITEPTTKEMREAVRAVFIAMMSARP